MAGDFQARMDELLARVGTGTLTAKVEYDQVYAHRQHEDLTLKHPQGGGPKYLERALYGNIPEFMNILARHALEDPKRGMIEVVELLAKESSAAAPVRAGFLRYSDHVSVEENGTVVYDRPPSRPHLNPEDIEALNKAFQPPRHWYGAWPPAAKVKEAAHVEAYRSELARKRALRKALAQRGYI